MALSLSSVNCKGRIPPKPGPDGFWKSGALRLYSLLQQVPLWIGEPFPVWAQNHAVFQFFEPFQLWAPSFSSFKEFAKSPGPVVIGAVPGASCMGAGYEYLFNFDRHARKAGIRKDISITWVTPEPALGHFGIGGIKGGELMLKTFLKMQGIDYRADAGVKEVDAGSVTLTRGEKLPAKFKMLVPP